MATFRIQQILDCFEDSRVDVRTAALNVLSDSYATDCTILPAIFRAWDAMGVESAFRDFPMLTYLPADPQHVAEVCTRAKAMAEGRKLVDPQTRAAGKLMEQQLQLPAESLHCHLSNIRETVASSKIFFRVDLELLSRRIEMVGKSPDDIAAVLDAALQSIWEGGGGRSQSDALIALETLRRHHPNYIDLGLVLSSAPASEHRSWGGFWLTLQSLVQFPAEDLEWTLARHLGDQRESVMTMAVEALVRCGTYLAASAMIECFDEVNTKTQHWIARGLQRIRHPKLVSEIAKKVNQLPSASRELQSPLVHAMVAQLDDFAMVTEYLPLLDSSAKGSQGLVELHARVHQAI